MRPGQLVARTSSSIVCKLDILTRCWRYTVLPDRARAYDSRGKQREHGFYEKLFIFIFLFFEFWIF